MRNSNHAFTYPDTVDEDGFAAVIHRMKRPDRPVDMVLDTDAYNEVDDQYAIAYMMSSQDRLRVQAITAAPFFNHHAEDPKDGMVRSCQEILHVLSLLGCSHMAPRVFPGGGGFPA